MAEKTTDYKKFKILRGNRAIKPKHLKNVAKSIALYPELLPTRPILVNENFEVIDGQHRLEAVRQLGLPVYYEVAEGLTANDAVAMNTNQMNWEMADYVNSHAAQGNPHYVKLNELLEEYGDLPTTTVISYCVAGHYGGGISRRIRNGEIVLDDTTDSEKYLEYLRDLISVNKYMFGRRSVQMAMLNIFKNDNYEHNRMLKKAAIGSHLFIPYGKSDDIRRNIEDVYNYHNHGEIQRLF